MHLAERRADVKGASGNLQNSGRCLEDYAYEKFGHVDRWNCGNYGTNEWACPTSGDWVTWTDGNITPCLWQ